MQDFIEQALTAVAALNNPLNTGLYSGFKD
jgi:hypothetical protein